MQQKTGTDNNHINDNENSDNMKNKPLYILRAIKICGINKYLANAFIVK